MGKDKKTITTIHISRKVLLDIRNSGIDNVSKYFEDLAKADLYSIDKMSVKEKDVIKTLNDELVFWTKEWDKHEAKNKRGVA